MAILSITSMVSCTVKKETSDSTATATAPTAPVDVVPTPKPTAEPWSQNEYTKGVPVVTCGVKFEEISGEGMFLVLYDDVTDEEFAAYKQALIDSGFEHISSDVEDSYRNAEGKTVSVSCNKTMTVTIIK